jgi:hypothetical protein
VPRFFRRWWRRPDAEPDVVVDEAAGLVQIPPRTTRYSNLRLVRRADVEPAPVEPLTERPPGPSVMGVTQRTEALRELRERRERLMDEIRQTPLGRDLVAFDTAIAALEVSLEADPAKPGPGPGTTSTPSATGSPAEPTTSASAPGSDPPPPPAAI